MIPGCWVGSRRLRWNMRSYHELFSKSDKRIVCRCSDVRNRQKLLVHLLQRIDALLELNVLVRELRLLVGGAELLLDKLRRAGRKGRELGAARRKTVSNKSTINNSQWRCGKTCGTANQCYCLPLVSSSSARGEPYLKFFPKAWILSILIVRAKEQSGDRIGGMEGWRDGSMGRRAIAIRDG